MQTKKLFTLLLAALPAWALADGQHAGAANGKPGNPAKVDRVIEVGMDDSMRFAPAQIEVKAGETIRFLLKNAGKMEHEMVLGQMAELKAHAEMMRRMPEMQHAEPNMVKLKPGQRGGIVWQFTQAGEVDFACTIPGHLEGGMVGKVSVK
ncbi:cupredoxin domain-containing protein [Pseudoduganella violacea]|uniref:Putative cupredoxin-like copper-binding protein n=1 Tax=Pseudoduganella violacea TaxID=1715466 RepID=A0A7W5BEK3_9BURK|nr:cupredoxin family protein [Pseudoduganella violacea]MBB3121741.1 putative cupredoxin-like copper-binding protein [Pseudoduganella violacea]